MSEQRQPTWGVVIGLAMLWFVTVAVSAALLLTFQGDIEANGTNIERIEANAQANSNLLADIRSVQDAGAERSYILRAIAGCSDLINDGEIEVTKECTDPNVVAYYSPSICAKINMVDGCGSKAVLIDQQGAP